MNVTKLAESKRGVITYLEWEEEGGEKGTSRWPLKAE